MRYLTFLQERTGVIRTAQMPASCPALLAGRDIRTAATSSARRRRIGLRRRRNASNVEVIWLLSTMSKFTSTCRAKNLEDGSVALV